jgi:hypothetical protein
MKQEQDSARDEDRDLESESENLPGVIEERRFFLNASLAAVAGLILGRAGVTRAQGWAKLQVPLSAGHPELDFGKFFQECLGLAAEATRGGVLNEDAHIYRISAVAARLRLETVPNTKTGAFAGLNPPVEFGPVQASPPLVIILWRMAPGATLPAHNHTPADVVSLCLRGEVRVRHFDIVGEAPEYSSKQTFHIRETCNLLLTQGRMSGLTQVRDNIHTFHAGEQGALGIDINTFLPGDKNFSFLDFADKPLDAEKKIYEAVWKKT